MLENFGRRGKGRMQEQDSSGTIAFALVYLTFFLDNVLLTVLVPIIPDWVRGESLELWSQHDAPLAKLLNSTVRHVTQDNGEGVGSSQLLVGAVLGAKAAAQLLSAPGAASLVSLRGAATCLRLATALLTIAALTFGVCAGGSVSDGVGSGGAACAGAGRAVQGAGAALGGVAGLALVARALPHAQHRALAALLGAVALGVLVGYPFGGAAYKLWSSAAPFQLIAFALLINLGGAPLPRPDGRSARPPSRGQQRGGRRVCRCRSAHHKRHGRARTLSTALDYEQVPSPALGAGCGVRTGQRGLPGGERAGPRVAARGRRARRRRRRRLRRGRRDDAAAGSLRGVAVNATVCGGRGPGRGGRGSSAGTAGARSARRAPSARRSAAGCFQRRLRRRAGGGRLGVVGGRVRARAVRAGRRQRAIRRGAVPRAQTASTVATVGRQRVSRRERSRRRGADAAEDASPRPMHQATTLMKLKYKNTLSLLFNSITF